MNSDPRTAPEPAAQNSGCAISALLLLDIVAAVAVCIFAGLLQASLAGGCDEPRTGLCREGRLVFSTKVLLGYLAVLDVGLLIWCLRVPEERRQIRAALLVFIVILIGAVVFSIYVHS